MDHDSSCVWVQQLMDEKLLAWNSRSPPLQLKSNLLLYHPIKDYWSRITEQLNRNDSVNVIKINFDIGVQKRSNLGAIVAIARDHLGRLMGWSCRRVPTISDPLTLESLACWDAMILARNHGFKNIIIEGDSLSMTQATKGNLPPSNI
uniref:RNase H type-1 domain-containing protein n=1 Tax=Manihot esculenta TaxID=3983 RepID=A0A2C9VIR8_MANES